MDKNTITRQELYEMLWKEPLTTISKRLNIPYAQLRKVCNEMNIPVPSSGYWIKLRFRKPVTVIELPADYNGINEVQITQTKSLDDDPNVLTITKKSAVEEIKADPKLTLTVPKKLTNPDELVLNAQKQLMEYKYDRYNDYGMVRSEGAFTIRVTRSNIGRALLFIDTLIKLLKSRGHILAAKYSRSLEIDGESYKLKLMEKTKKGEPDPKWRLPRYENTGLLYFLIDGYHGRMWTDGKVPIEEKLPEILAKLETRINYWTNLRREQAEERRKREEQERIIREQRERIEKEKAAFDDLYQQAKRWQRSRFIREYLNAYEQNAIEKGGLTDEVKNWLLFSRDKVDCYDPLVNKPDALLNHLNINKVLDS
jgi:hypothetical protein